MLLWGNRDASSSSSYTLYRLTFSCLETVILVLNKLYLHIEGLCLVYSMKGSMTKEVVENLKFGNQCSSLAL